MRRVLPVDDTPLLNLDTPDARQTLLEWYAPPGPEHLRLSLVSTLDGRAAGADGTSESLTSHVDRMILGVIRELADVVLVGAQSVRREGYVRPRRAALAVVSASGDLSGHRLDEHPERDAAVLVLTTAAGARRAAETVPAARVIALPDADDGGLAPPDLIAALHGEGWRAIAAEGGPTLAAQLVAHSLVDELCLTVMPRIGGPTLPLFGPADSAVTSLSATQLLVDDSGAVYGRWSMRP